jgi:hypothetical protein
METSTPTQSAGYYGTAVGRIKAVNGIDANGEGPPDTISYDIQYITPNGAGIAAGVANSWKLHSNTIDGVSVLVKPLAVGSPVVVMVFGNVVEIAFPERIKMRACPPA